MNLHIGTDGGWRALLSETNSIHTTQLIMTPTLVLTVALLVGLGMNQINEAEKDLKK